MFKYIRIWDIWFIRLRYKHSINCGINKYSLHLIIIPLVVFIFFGILDFTLEIKISDITLTVLPLLNMVLIGILYNLKINFQTNQKYKNLRRINLIEAGKETSVKYTVFLEYLSFIEYSILLLVLSIFFMIIATFTSSSIVTIITLSLFVYSFVFFINTIEIILDRVK